LLDDQGYFHATTADVRRQAKSEAVRIEMRRQIDLGVRSGINPSHIDNHMMVAMCDEFLQIYIQAGREGGIRVRPVKYNYKAACLRAMIVPAGPVVPPGDLSCLATAPSISAGSPSFKNSAAAA